VCDSTGERSDASFSGGERTRINLALRIGLARLIASRKGSDMRVLALDEPEFLDVEGLRRLPQVLRSLTEFDTVLLISHDETLSDQFDQTVTVVRDGDRSEVRT
jgi:exonuclease SbcC